MPPFWYSNNKEVDDIEKIPVEHRDAYSEGDDGIYRLGSDNPALQTTISSILRLEQALKNERKVKKSDLTPLQDFGETPEAIREAFDARIAELETKLSEKSAIDPKKIRDEVAAELRRQHQSEVEKLTTEKSGLSTQLDGLLIDNQIADAVEKHSPGRLEIWKPILRQHIKAETDSEGNRQVYVMDASGEPRYSGATADTFSIEELLLEHKSNPTYAPLFPSDAPSGSGTAPTIRNGVRPRDTRRQLDATEKIAVGMRKRVLPRHDTPLS